MRAQRLQKILPKILLRPETSDTPKLVIVESDPPGPSMIQPPKTLTTNYAKRREQNNLACRKFRAKHKEEFQSNKERIKMLEKENEMLRQIIHLLKQKQ